MATELRLSLLGGVHVTLGGEPVTGFISNKALALLCYLAITARPHQRDTLAGIFWGELPEADAKANLRQALANLRKLTGDFIETDRQTAAFNRALPYWLDVEEFERNIQEEGRRKTEDDSQSAIRNLQSAIGLYRADFLSGLILRDAPAFDDWLTVERERLHGLALNGLRALVAHHARHGAHAEAIPVVRRWLGLEPWNEEAHRRMMELLARTGQRSAALAQYETCRRALADELGVEPAPETTALYDRLRASTRRSNLPPAATPFVGRAEELAQIASLLADPTCRLTTLTGPGGSGKTRLALEAAARAADAFLNGVCFVPLAAVSSLEVVPSAIAEALGLALSGKADPRDQLVAHLRNQDLLLVLDNLEHLPGADELLGRIALACPDVRLLVTSRERLNLHGEQLIELSGLDVPPDADGESITEYSAAQLFLNSARSAQPDFALDGENRTGVARICRLVNGLPLAIELAAVWVRQFSCREIADEIARSLDFLATTQKNVPARHRSLQAAFEHSYALLSADEQRAFAWLSVFHGGCEREAAAAITTYQLPVLAALCDKSLIRRDVNGRYSIHELLRQYADGKLRAEPQVFGEAQARHCEYYIAFLGAREDAQNDARQNEARREIAAEIDNIRAAWSWAVAQPQLDVLEPSLESLRVFLEHAGWYTEAASLFGAAAEAERAVAGDDSPLLGKLLARQAWFYHRLDRFEAARPLIQQSQMIFRNAQPPLPAEEALCLQCLGNMARAVGDFAQAIEYARQSLSLHRVAGNPRSIAASLNTLGTVHTERGEFEEARRLQEESLAIKREIGDRRGIAIALVNLGNVALAQGQYAEAKPFEQEALAVFREIGYAMGEAVSLNNLGVACHMLSEYAEARLLLQECLTLCRELGHRHIAAHALGSLGGVAGALGEYREAWQHTREALQMAREIGSVSATLFGLVSAAVLLARQEERGRAAEVAALVCHHAAANRETKDRAEKLLVELEAQLPAPVMAAAQERGRARQLEEVVAEILQT
ncbi:MAG: tetratricopeptide repeat protein [Chloroflexi bacterium]|nr:tetratricopeptide repeat protein [Chloroflexota bacterium]